MSQIPVSRGVADWKTRASISTVVLCSTKCHSAQHAFTVTTKEVMTYQAIKLCVSQLQVQAVVLGWRGDIPCMKWHWTWCLNHFYLEIYTFFRDFMQQRMVGSCRRLGTHYLSNLECSSSVGLRGMFGCLH
jgi:hypothetical protein